MKKALVLTVGTGTRKNTYIVDPLCKAVKACNPNFTVLIATRQSKPYALEIVRRCGLAESEYKIVKLTDENDLEKTFLEIEKAINLLKRKGYQPEEIDVDFTSGTKPMSAAAVLSAIRHQCNYLRYISGDREHGVVKSGREKPLPFPAASILALHQLDLANSFLKLLRFKAASEVIERIKISLATDEDRELAEDLLRIATAYERWDKFDHQGFLRHYKNVKFSHSLAKPYKMGKRTPPLLQKLLRANKRGSYSFLAVADLLNNAERRAYEAKFDDAVARIYRSVEMLGQYVLQERYGINSSSVDLEKLSDEERETLHLNGTRKEPAKIGRAQVFQLLAERKDKLGLSYMKNNKLQAILVQRNSSILAHGSRPIEESAYKALLNETLNLCRIEDRKIDTIRKALQFPWLL